MRLVILDGEILVERTLELGQRIAERFIFVRIDVGRLGAHPRRARMIVDQHCAEINELRRGLARLGVGCHGAKSGAGALVAVVQLENPAVDRDGLVGCTLAHERVAQLDVGIAQPDGIAHPRRNLDACLMAGDGVGLSLNEFGRHLVGVQPLALVLIEGQRPFQPCDAAGAVTVFKQGMGGDALAEGVIGRGRRTRLAGWLPPRPSRGKRGRRQYPRSVPPLPERPRRFRSRPAAQRVGRGRPRRLVETGHPFEGYHVAGRLLHADKAFNCARIASWGRCLRRVTASRWLESGDRPLLGRGCTRLRVNAGVSEGGRFRRTLDLQRGGIQKHQGRPANPGSALASAAGSAAVSRPSNSSSNASRSRHPGNSLPSFSTAVRATSA